MTGIGTVAALTLAAVLGWAAVGKARRIDASTATYRRLGLPAVRFLGVAVPAVEGATALLLVTWPRIGGLIALALLAAFTVVLLRARRLGVACGCFGTDRTEPVSSVELLRNAMLGALAASALGAAAPTVPGLADVVTVTAATVTGAVVIALADIRRRTGRLLDNTMEVGP